MSLPAFVKAAPDGAVLSVKVQPRAAKNEIAGPLGGELKIKVTAPPVDAAANQALVDFLAGTLDCPRSAVRIVRGQTARHKTVSIRGIPPETVAARLQPSAS